MVEITDLDLYHLYLAGGWDDIMPYPDFKARCKLAGMKITKEEPIGLEKGSN